MSKHYFLTRKTTKRSKFKLKRKLKIKLKIRKIMQLKKKTLVLK